LGGGAGGGGGGGGGGGWEGAGEQVRARHRHRVRHRVRRAARGGARCAARGGARCAVRGAGRCAVRGAARCAVRCAARCAVRGAVRGTCARTFGSNRASARCDTCCCCLADCSCCSSDWSERGPSARMCKHLQPMRGGACVGASLRAGGHGAGLVDCPRAAPAALLTHRDASVMCGGRDGIRTISAGLRDRLCFPFAL